MGVIYVGIGLFGGLGSFFVHYLTKHFGFRTALMSLGGVMLLAWPLAFFVLQDRPSEIGQYPDGAAHPPPDITISPLAWSALFRNTPFWMLLIGSVCSIGSIGQSTPT